jgi:hypothetical protein
MKCDECEKEGSFLNVEPRVFPSGIEKNLCSSCFEKAITQSLSVKTNHSLIGKISIILGVISFPGIFLFFRLAGLIVENISNRDQIFSIIMVTIGIPVISGIIAIVLGLKALSKKDNFGIIAVILGPLSLILGVYILFLSMFSLMN